MLAKTPPMGWNSWNSFTDKIDESLILETADALVEKGLRDAGYEYLVIDDCWSERERDRNGQLVADRVKFPHGMKYVADYVHSKGLKFGMYSCCGPRTCADFPGSMDHEFDDAKFFADVGCDLLKYDNCFHPSTPGIMNYNRMALALRASGREILFSACNWGKEEVWKWARSVGAHMYRSTGDINDSFESVLRLSESQKENLCCSGSGCFNDIDMLIAGIYNRGHVGGTGCTAEQYRYHFALWCMFMSPLMLGCDVRTIAPETLELVTNKNLIRINQDEECRPPIFLSDNRGIKEGTTCFRHLSGNNYAIGLFKPYQGKRRMMLSFREIGFDVKSGYGFELTDAFTDEKLGVFNEYVDVPLDDAGCAVFLAKLVKLDGYGKTSTSDLWF